MRNCDVVLSSIARAFAGNTKYPGSAAFSWPVSSRQVAAGRLGRARLWEPISRELRIAPPGELAVLRCHGLQHELCACNRGMCAATEAKRQHVVPDFGALHVARARGCRIDRQTKILSARWPLAKLPVEVGHPGLQRLGGGHRRADLVANDVQLRQRDDQSGEHHDNDCGHKQLNGRKARCATRAIPVLPLTGGLFMTCRMRHPCMMHTLRRSGQHFPQRSKACWICAG